MKTISTSVAAARLSSGMSWPLLHTRRAKCASPKPPRPKRWPRSSNLTLRPWIFLQIGGELVRSWRRQLVFETLVIFLDLLKTWTRTRPIPTRRLPSSLFWPHLAVKNLEHQQHFLTYPLNLVPLISMMIRPSSWETLPPTTLITLMIRLHCRKLQRKSSQSQYQRRPRQHQEKSNRPPNIDILVPTPIVHSLPSIPRTWPVIFEVIQVKPVAKHPFWWWLPCTIPFLGEKPFQCEVCDRTFARQDKLKLHQRIHSGVKPFQCKQCSYSCSDSWSLRKHERVHTNERPYQ